jgi:hypothetical protein
VIQKGGVLKKLLFGPLKILPLVKSLMKSLAKPTITKFLLNHNNERSKIRT